MSAPTKRAPRKAPAKRAAAGKAAPRKSTQPAALTPEQRALVEARTALRAAEEAAAAAEAAATDADETAVLTSEQLTAELVELLGGEEDDSPFRADGSFKPVKIGKKGRTPNPMADLFELDGVMYQVPLKPNPFLVQEFMRQARDPRIGKDVAVVNALTAMLGREPLEALRLSPEVTEEDAATIYAIVAKIFFDSFPAVEKAQDPS